MSRMAIREPPERGPVPEKGAHLHARGRPWQGGQAPAPRRLGEGPSTCQRTVTPGARGLLCAHAPGPRLRRVKIYTRTGDDGTTGLLGPGRVSKHAARVEAYGSVDELNAALGAARTLAAGGPPDPELAAVQARLFNVGAELATTSADMLAKLDRITDDDVDELERWIDRLDADLPPLASFVLPGGAPLAAQLHVARATCRRAERRLVALLRDEPVEPRLVRYLNRLGDLLFTLARWCNRRAGVAETEWHPRRG